MKRKLSQLSLPELKTLYEVIDSGYVDGNSTPRIRIESEGYHSGHEKWKERLVKREEILSKINNEIRNRVNEIDLKFVSEELFRHNIVCARATLYPGKTIEEVHKIVDEIEKFSEGYGQGLEHGTAEAKVDTPEVDIKQIAFEAFSLWRDAHDIKAFKNKFNKWFDEKYDRPEKM